MRIVKTYKDYNVDFIIQKDLEDYFKDRKININEMFADDWFWFEALLFELIDDDADGLPDDVYGKNFLIVFYGIIEDLKKNNPIGFDNYLHGEESKLIEDEMILNVESKFFAKYAVFKK
jgi:hypothetical protein